MKKITLTTFTLVSLALASCGQESDREARSGNPPAGSAGEASAGIADDLDDQPLADEIAGPVHSGSGDITKIDGNRVTISHGPVESIGWSAMTMTFIAQSPGMIEGLAIGDPVNFEFGQSGETYVLTSINRDTP
jgi:Cu/Ag efflux protein CusF